MSQYLTENTKTGDFNLQRTLSGSFFVLPERLASIYAVVMVFTTNKQTLSKIYIYRIHVVITLARKVNGAISGQI